MVLVKMGGEKFGLVKESEVERSVKWGGLDVNVYSGACVCATAESGTSSGDKVMDDAAFLYQYDCARPGMVRPSGG